MDGAGVKLDRHGCSSAYTVSSVSLQSLSSSTNCRSIRQRGAGPRHIFVRCGGEPHPQSREASLSLLSRLRAGTYLYFRKSNYFRINLEPPMLVICGPLPRIGAPEIERNFPKRQDCRSYRTRHFLSVSHCACASNVRFVYGHLPCRTARCATLNALVFTCGSAEITLNSDLSHSFSWTSTMPIPMPSALSHALRLQHRISWNALAAQTRQWQHPGRLG